MESEQMGSQARTWQSSVARCLFFGALALWGFSAIGSPLSGAPSVADAQPARSKEMSTHRYVKPSEAELRKKLTPLQYEVTQHDATEPPFRNPLWNNHEAGLY